MAKVLDVRCETCSKSYDKEEESCPFCAGEEQTESMKEACLNCQNMSILPSASTSIETFEGLMPGFPIDFDTFSRWCIDCQRKQIEEHFELLQKIEEEDEIERQSVQNMLVGYRYRIGELEASMEEMARLISFTSQTVLASCEKKLRDAYALAKVLEKERARIVQHIERLHADRADVESQRDELHSCLYAIDPEPGSL